MKPLSNPFKIFSWLLLAVLISANLPILNAQAATSTTFSPVADAYVTQNYSNNNYGRSTSLRVDMSPTVVGYLKFTVQGLSGATVQSAALRVYGNSLSNAGYAAKTVSSNSWSENTITYKNAPATGTTLGKSGSFSAGSWTSVDVSAYIKGEGTFSLALVDLSNAAINLASRESANRPQLVLTLSSGSTTTQTPVPTQPPSSTPTPTPNPTQPPTSGTNPVGVPGTWNLKWSDEFNGSSLDLNKWEPNWLAGNTTAITKPVNSYEESCYDPAQVSVGGGYLKLSAVARSCTANNGVTYKYASGLVNSHSRYTFTYGYLEARVWLDGSSSVKNWPAFWADGTGTWPTTGEIDVMEGLGGSPAWHYHWGSTGSHQQTGATPALTTKTGWHVFGADWEPGSIKFYYDGKYVGQATSGVVSSQMYVIFDYAVSSQISGPIQVPSDFLVDYVRVWQH